MFKALLRGLMYLVLPLVLFLITSKTGLDFLTSYLIAMLVFASVGALYLIVSIYYRFENRVTKFFVSIKMSLWGMFFGGLTFSVITTMFGQDNMWSVLPVLGVTFGITCFISWLELNFFHEGIFIKKKENA